MNRAKAEKMCADLLKAAKADQKKSEYSKEEILPLMKVLEKYDVVKKDKKADYECVGQMNITDFPEYMPEDYEL